MSAGQLRGFQLLRSQPSGGRRPWIHASRRVHRAPAERFCFNILLAAAPLAVIF